MEIVESNDHYDVLGVLSSASQKEIRDAYKQKVMQLHPDKNPNNDELIAAAERFQRLTEAHAVLTDSVQREIYDLRQGHRKKRENNSINDPHEAFKDYIGQLTLASNAFSELANTIDNPLDLHHELDILMESIQKEREKKLVGAFKDALDALCVHGDKDTLRKHVMSDAQLLSATAYQADVLHLIGQIYSSQAAQELGKKAILLSVPFLTQWFRNKSNYKKALRIVEEEVRPLVRSRQDERRMTKRYDLGKDIAESSESRSLIKDDTTARKFWKLNAADIEVTLVHVCQMVLQDSDATKKELKDRAMALKIFGKIFQEHGRKDIGGTSHTSMGEDNIVTEIAAEGVDDGGTSSTSTREAVSYQTRLTQGIGRLCRCLCNRALDLDDADIAE